MHARSGVGLDWPGLNRRDPQFFTSSFGGWLGGGIQGIEKLQFYGGGPRFRFGQWSNGLVREV